MQETAVVISHSSEHAIGIIETEAGLKYRFFMPPHGIDSAPVGQRVTFELYDAGGKGTVARNLVPVPVFLPQLSSLHFDGIDDYVSIPHHDKLHLSNIMTFEAWVYPTGYQPNVHPQWGVSGIVAKNRPEGVGYGLFLAAQDKLSLFLNDGRNNNVGAIAPTVVPLNTWSHVAGTYDGNTIRLYWNGIPVHSQAASINLLNWNTPLMLGMGVYTGCNFMGNLAEVRVWNVARTAAEIAAHKDKSLTSLETGLVAYYRLDNSAKNDSTTRGLDGTLMNFALSGNTSNWTTNVPPVLVG